MGELGVAEGGWGVGVDGDDDFFLEDMLGEEHVSGREEINFMIFIYRVGTKDAQPSGGPEIGLAKLPCAEMGREG